MDNPLLVRVRRFVQSAIVGTFVLLFLPGCTPLNFNLSKLDFNKDDDPVTPTRMIPVWTDTVLTRSGKQGVRGFGGRIVFYQNERHDPVHVDGSIIVYAWDDTAGHTLSETPDRKYVITAEQLPSHFSKSRVGASYSIWVPWDEAGGDHRKITLVTRFVGANGAEVMSQPINAVLPGPTDEEITMEVEKETLTTDINDMRDSQAEPPGLLEPAGGEIQQAAWQSVSPPEETLPAQPRMKTTTLNVTPAFAAQHFGDNSAPLILNRHPAGARDTDGDVNSAAMDGSVAAPIPMPAMGHSAETMNSANRSLSTHSEPTQLPAQTGRPARPAHSPLRSQPRRAAWQPRPRPQPQSLHGTSWQPPATPPAEVRDRLPAAEAQGTQTQW